ncbi:hypothetical protein U9M48_013749 [Paspalum notatum var. saurae]|uniref:Uncharacterized protein n=1 Tax=Paspalum notatum var. saurae TaxID=547442 RepID=A0AAQ3T2I9_PASNO
MPLPPAARCGGGRRQRPRRLDCGLGRSHSQARRQHGVTGDRASAYLLLPASTPKPWQELEDGKAAGSLGGVALHGRRWQVRASVPPILSRNHEHVNHQAPQLQDLQLSSRRSSPTSSSSVARYIIRFDIIR